MGRYLKVWGGYQLGIRVNPEIDTQSPPVRAIDANLSTSKTRFEYSRAHAFDDSPPLSSRTRSSLKKKVQIECSVKSSKGFNNGWRSCRKSITETRKASTSCNGVGGIEGLRQSPRLLNRGNSKEPVDEVLSQMGETTKLRDGLQNETKAQPNKRVTRSSLAALVATVGGEEMKVISCDNIAEGDAKDNHSSKLIEGNLERPVIVAALAVTAVGRGERKVGENAEANAKENHSSAQIVERVLSGGSVHPDITPDVGKKHMRRTSKGSIVIGVQKRRKQIEEIDRGWTNEQESALQRAYFATNPTPHFWKKVAKQVPGKCAQECFDKVNFDNPTPLPTARSRPKRENPSPPHSQYSASKLLKFAEQKSKGVVRGKQSHISQRTVRHLLRKCYGIDQGGESDLFSILEPNVNPLDHIIQQATPGFTPVQPMKILGSSPLGNRISSSGHKKRLSRFSSTNGTSLVSPPVLKQVKNVALHEKFIDQLHSREAKRKAASVFDVKSPKKGKEEGHIRNRDAIGAAKNALVSDARDAIRRFQHLQVNITENSSDSDDCFNEEDDDEV
ncbi:hypothetical protein Nepgr_026496 [Nepenthes gracilis]|uniref:Myb-like domain-containing protein n=1 Tax=Nepenthes gracilis TaxID=150966 RepID=A0AAD3T876_NEPGR|nr:hypothetical protein Nepgr_026496 [Nepenthes gracilis]